MKITQCTAKELVNKVDADSVDLILTDPPYPKEYLNCYSELCDLAVHALKPGGFVLAMSSQAWLPQIFQLMGSEKLRYQWTISLILNGGGLNEMNGRNFCMIRWKPILVFIKPPVNFKIQLVDIIKGIGKRDKRFHHWGQSEDVFDYLLDKMKIKEGSLVCDPFLGGGTTAVCAVRRGCNFIGCDIDSSAIKITKQRLKAVQQNLILSYEEKSPPQNSNS